MSCIKYLAMYKLHAVLSEKQSRSWRFLNLRHKGSLKGGQIVWRRFVGLQEQIWVGTLHEWRVRSYTSLTTHKQTLVRSEIVIRVRSERFFEILTASKQLHSQLERYVKKNEHQPWVYLKILFYNGKFVGEVLIAYSKSEGSGPWTRCGLGPAVCVRLADT